MADEFFVVADPGQPLCAEAAALEPANPYHAPAYLAARRTLGARPWMLTVRDGGRLVAACPAFVRRGRLSGTAEIPSLPGAELPEVFWQGLARFCREQHITHLTVDSFASARAEIPALRGEVSRRGRTEHVLVLTGTSAARLASNHRRNMQRARKAGVRIERTRDSSACDEHGRLTGASFQRRERRGEVINADAQAHVWRALLESGAAEFFRATLAGRTLSSVLVLRAERGGYYMSAGTSPEGMEQGASHFLIHGIAEVLRDERAELFNLGGADEQSAGLQRFKAGFGAEAVPLEAACFYLGSMLRNRLERTVRVARENPVAALRELLGRRER